MIMPFGLQNLVPTFQLSMRITLDSQLDRNMEAYVDDTVVETRKSESFLFDLEETFANLWKNRVKFNPDK